MRVKVPFELRRGLLLRATVMSKLRNFARFAECVIRVFSADRLKLSLSVRKFAMFSFIRKASFLLPIIPTRRRVARGNHTAQALAEPDLNLSAHLGSHHPAVGLLPICQ